MVKEDIILEMLRDFRCRLEGLVDNERLEREMAELEAKYVTGS